MTVNKLAFRNKYFCSLADAFLLHGSELHLYSKINIENVKINTRTVAVFKALPTCIAQPDCGACVSLRARSAFQCMWCEAAGHCSDGADRYIFTKSFLAFTKSFRASLKRLYK